LLTLKTWRSRKIIFGGKENDWRLDIWQIIRISDNVPNIIMSGNWLNYL
jgi:hypothetical protein